MRKGLVAATMTSGLRRCRPAGARSAGLLARGSKNPSQVEEEKRSVRL